jgi:hypothetical protein
VTRGFSKHSIPALCSSVTPCLRGWFKTLLPLRPWRPLR